MDPNACVDDAAVDPNPCVDDEDAVDPNPCVDAAGELRLLSSEI